MPVERTAPVTFGQLSVIRSLDVYGNGGHAAANLASAWEIPPDVGVAHAWEAWLQLVAAHESLRTSYNLSPPTPEQVVHTFAGAAVEAVEVSDARVGTALRAAGRSMSDPIAMTQPRPWRAFVATHDGRPVHLVTVIHHIAADNGALNVLRGQFHDLLTGTSVPSPVQPVGLSLGQRARSDGASIEHWTSRWGTVLDEDRRRDDVSVRRRASVYSVEALAAARTLARELNVSIQSLVLAVGMLALARFTDRTRISFGLMAANRLDEESANVVSSLNQCVPLTLEADPDRAPEDFLRSVYLECLGAYFNGVFDVDALRVSLNDSGFAERDPTFFGVHYNFLGEGDGEPEPDAPMRTGVQWRPSAQRVGPYFHLVVAVQQGLLLGVGASEDFLPGNAPADLAMALEAGLISLADQRPERLADVSLAPRATRKTERPPLPDRPPAHPASSESGADAAPADLGHATSVSVDSETDLPLDSTNEPHERKATCIRAIHGRDAGVDHTDAMVIDPTEPGTPDLRGALRYLWWLVTRQRTRVAAGGMLGTAWMVLLMLPPYLLSRAIDALAPARWPALLGWTGALFAVGVVNAWLSIMRHRTMTRVRLDAFFRTLRLVVRHSTRLGTSLSGRIASGEVVTIGQGDAGIIAQSLTVTGPGIAAVVAYVVVAALMLSVSPLLAAVVLLGVPVLAVLVGPLLSRLQGMQATYWQRQGALTAQLVNLTGGLRILRGLPGGAVFGERYRGASRELQSEGYRIGGVTSWVMALGVGLPTLFLAGVTWLAARAAAAGDVTIGDLVAVYGYAAVLTVPVSAFIEGAYEIGAGRIAARRVIDFLRLERDVVDSEPTEAGPPSTAALHEPNSDVTVAPGRLNALVSARLSESTVIIDRLARFVRSDATWGAVRLDRMALREVRRRILVADNDAYLFAGPLHDMISPSAAQPGEAVAAAVHAAAADDVVDGLPDGVRSRVAGQGRDLSGGQRQRIRLARALLADAEVLVAVEPTSALDVHTEALVAGRLRSARAGRTTLVASTSPMMLEVADVVHYVVDGRLVATGGHEQLLREQPGYRRLVGGDVTNGGPEPERTMIGERSQ